MHLEMNVKLRQGRIDLAAHFRGTNDQWIALKA